MHFEWDEIKNQANIRKHGIDFNDVPDIFQHPMLALRDDRTDYGEERWISIGWIKILLGVVVYTERRGDAIRIISARKATKQEAKYYAERIEN
ncbi:MULTISPECIES: BrnT family toxin [Pseudomonas]|uniref:BrnT family toxin n=1 Tax=Pseudomonas gingeri TaxID=117681 RepID=A0A7Y7Y9D3_9PSED|nr:MULTISPECIES: BrnT family toxin [Pseudomonas]NWB28874.1 BrnT family toxin [Pseudomonas gingeri]NWC32252.1 BrnT family toxin [Pseudomonas gingeri]NWD08600.1 BrnT family toxin [Pseudomonas gingeri]NWD50332.1 BrnT family toxin [Pseudomonas gingeri]NWE27839.1 BrnT family toxin [Pseudomonas gingeri]